MSHRNRVAIIGAGMAGLTLGEELGKALGDALGADLDIRIFDKSHGVGGRMATRRRDDGLFDHGAQYFTARDARFREMLSGHEAHGTVAPWTGEIVTLAEDGSVAPDGRSGVRYVGCPTMNALPKAMALPLDITVNAQISAISGEPGRWILQTGEGEEGPFDWVVSTAPAPQSAALLPAGFRHHAALAQVRMNACFTLMVAPRHPLVLTFAAARPAGPVIDWIGRNETKPGRSGQQCLTVNASAAWSDAHIDAPLEDVRRDMLQALQTYLPLSPEDAEAATLHRWRYANVAQTAGADFLLDETSQLAACGDWCIGGRVEAAFLSALALADALSPILKGASA
jgi:predicted NAD/FAD-dependent oxidoreductase